jgi:glycosyltransferase involved in cell wall biosynthesis
VSNGNAVPDGIAVDLLFAAKPFTGLEHHALHILRGLHKVGASVDVFVPADVIADLGDAATGHQIVPFPRVPRGLRLGREQWALPWRFGAAPRALHLLHSVMGVAPVFSAVPLALTVPDLAYRIRPEDMHPRARWYFGTLGPRSIRKARRIMVSSHAVSREVIDLYHIAPERVSYVPLAADPIFSPRPSIEVADVRKSFGLPEHYVLYVGTIDPRKDLGRLRAAYELLPPDLTDDSALVFVGRTNRGAEGLARELRKSGPRVHVIGLDYVPREMLPAIYSGASIFVYPSRYEGFGLPVLEAMSCGAPVIVSSADALAELVDDSGIVLRTESVEELTQAMERLLRFEPEQLRLRNAGLTRSKAFSIERLGRETAEVYRQALAA